MLSLGRLLAIIIILGSFIKTFSYAVWVWKQKNRLGAIAVIALALLSLAVPAYAFFLNR
jgi:hypothetical protein